jgi:hypothetical protein
MFEREYLIDFCMEISLNPQMKQHIYSLNLSNKDSCGQIELFLKLFSLNEFSNLRSLSLTDIHEDDAILLKSMLPLIPQLYHYHLTIFNEKIHEISSVTDPKFWRSPTSLTAATSSPGKRCGCGCGGCASLKEMIHPQWQITTSSVEKCRISRGRCGISLREMLEISKILDL